MKTYDVLIIGFSKAGKLFAKDLTLTGKRVAMVEQITPIYAETCTNDACIPTMTLLHEALKNRSFTQAMERKYEVVQILNQKKFDYLAVEDDIDLYTLRAEFQSPDTIALKNHNSDEIIEVIGSHNIVIDTGSRPNILAIDGIDQVENVYDPASILTIVNQP